MKAAGRSAVQRVFHAKGDKEMVAIWNLSLTRVLHVFNVREI